MSVRLGFPTILWEFLDTQATLQARQMMIKLSKTHLGFIWSIIQPLTWIFMIVLLSYLFSRRSPIYTDFFLFTVAAILPFTIFNQCFSMAESAVHSNKALFYLRNVSILNISIAFSWVEFVMGIFSFIILIFGYYIIFDTLEMKSLASFSFWMLMAWVLGGSTGFFMGTLALFYPTIRSITPVIRRPLFWISALFYTANELPVTIQQVLWWNPLLHVIEGVRDGMFWNYQSVVLTPAMPILFSVFMMFFGMVLELRARRILSL